MDDNINLDSKKIEKTVQEIKDIMNKNDLNHAEAISVIALIKFESDTMVLMDMEIQ